MTEVIKVLEDAVSVSESGTALFKKQDRANLSDDKRNDLFARAIYQKQKKYDLLNLTIEDPTKLSETYDLGMNVLTTKANFTKYDMHDVFIVVVRSVLTLIFHELFCRIFYAHCRASCRFKKILFNVKQIIRYRFF